MPPRYATLDAVLQEKLHTWRLSPTEKRSKLWELCSYSGVVIVRAESAVQARELAAKAFCRDGSRAFESPASARTDPSSATMILSSFMCPPRPLSRPSTL